MFNRSWFAKHQKTLLWLLNCPIISLWFRRVLRISEYKQKITEILPNSLSWGDRVFFEKGELHFERTTDFRTHNKFSKRIFYALKPIWILCHIWDTLIANRLNPNWNLGFDFTYYPDPDAETNTVDGFVNRDNAAGESWATLIAGAGVGAGDSDASHYVVYIKSDDENAKWQSLFRSIFLFNTASLAGSAILSATLSICASDKGDEATWLPNINVYASNPASNTALVAADYGTLGTTPFATALAYGDWTDEAYNVFTLNAAGIAAISTSGITKFGLRNANYDVAAGSPTWASLKVSWFSGYYADAVGTATDPKLIVVTGATISSPALTVTITGQVPTATALLQYDIPAGTITITLNVPTVTKTGGWDLQDKNIASWTFTPKS